MKKKIVSAVLVATMAMSLLAGCGGKSNDAAKGSSASAGADGVTNISMEIITLGMDDADLTEVQEAVNAISEKEIGVNVTFVTVPIFEMATKLSLLSASGENIDLVQTGLLTTPSSLASQGLIEPMNDYLSDNLKDQAGVLLDACKIGDDIYAYPGNLYPGTSARLFYDKDLAEQYNIQIPEKLATADDWDKFFSQVKNSGMEQYAISLGDGVAAENQWGNIFDSLGDASYNSYGIVSDIEKGTKIENYYASDVYKETCKMHRDWFEKGYALPDSISNGFTTMDSMQQGQVFSFVSTSGTGTSEAYFSASTQKNLGSIPVGEDNRAIINTASVINTSWGISSGSENPQAVADFLDLMYSNQKINDLMNVGIEGKHYVVNEGSRIVSYPDGVDASNVGYGNFIGNYGDLGTAYFKAPLTDDFVNSLDEYSADKALCSRFMGYTFDTSSVESAITAVQAVITEYGPSLSCGTVNPDESIPQFNEALKAAGLDTIIEENQKQLDEWLAKQK